jgi:cytochrome o ubiquinol oxidase subunit I
LMGATRRLDHYDNQSWQWLFIVAGLGVLIICLGAALMILQLIVSIWQRKKNIALADPWNGRTLEWSVPSPSPFYNFAVTPTVTDRDQFWMDKQRTLEGEKSPTVQYRDISLPKNSGIGVFIAAFAFLVGFGLIWHMWWLAIIGLLGAIVCVIIRCSDDETEFTITAKQIEEYDSLNRMQERAV